MMDGPGRRHDAALAEVSFFHLLRVYCLATGIGAVGFSIYLILRMLVMWQIGMYAQVSSAFYFSLLVGTDVGVVVMIMVLALMAPHMIMTWITTLVFQVVLNRRDAVETSKWIAKEFWRVTLLQAVRNGEVAAIAAAVASLVGLAFWRPCWTFLRCCHV